MIKLPAEEIEEVEEVTEVLQNYYGFWGTANILNYFFLLPIFMNGWIN